MVCMVYGMPYTAQNFSHILGFEGSTVIFPTEREDSVGCLRVMTADLYLVEH